MGLQSQGRNAAPWRGVAVMGRRTLGRVDDKRKLVPGYWWTVDMIGSSFHVMSNKLGRLTLLPFRTSPGREVFDDILADSGLLPLLNHLRNVVSSNRNELPSRQSLRSWQL